MPPYESLDAPNVLKVMVTYRDLLRSHQEVVNRLNVYPVPDGDTGTNMALTLESVAKELLELPSDPSMEVVCKAVSHASLMGARGNSGVILSQLLRGFTERFSGVATIDAATLAGALVHADKLARQAVVRPVEGTILSVAKAAGEGAQASLDAGGSLLAVAESAREAAQVALDFTPEQLPQLKQAGVVDSGGTGYLLFFDALLHVLDGRELPEAPALEGIPLTTLHDLGESHGEGGGIADLRYEVMYLLEAKDEKIPAFKEVWAGIGDSIVVVGGDGIWNCHIHTDDIGASIEAAMDAGRPRQIRVTDLLEQVVEERWVTENVADAEPEATGPAPMSAVVAVVSGDGVGRIFKSLGVERLVVGGQSMNPSTEDLVKAVESLRSDHVVLLPNNKNIRPVAERVNELTAKTVTVVPTASIVEGFAALLAYDPGATAEENQQAMAQSAAGVIAAEVTQAVRDTTVDAGTVSVGDWIGLSREGILSIAATLPEAACRLLELLVTDDHDLVTLIEGDGSSAATTRRITEWLKAERPHVETEVHHGGQPLYPYLFGIE
jgi:DAK2 domain fusion protein YloV